MPKQKILVVEDDINNLEMLVRRLIRNDFNVVSANDGVTALKMISEEMPDLILLDIGLPGMDGWQVVERVKRDEKTASIPIIALTAYATREDYEKTMAVGCDHYLSKPIKFDELMTVVQSYLGK